LTSGNTDPFETGCGDIFDAAAPFANEVVMVLRIAWVESHRSRRDADLAKLPHRDKFAQRVVDGRPRHFREPVSCTREHLVSGEVKVLSSESFGDGPALRSQPPSAIPETLDEWSRITGALRHRFRLPERRMPSPFDPRSARV
jgi:hypothetical protein